MRVVILALLLIPLVVAQATHVVPILPGGQVTISAGQIKAVNIIVNYNAEVKPGDIVVAGTRILEMPGVEQSGGTITIDGDVIRANVDPQLIEHETWEIEDEEDLAAYAAAVALADRRVSLIAIDGPTLVLDYELDAKIAGLLPVTYQMKATLADEITIETPWWLSVASDDVHELKLLLANKFEPIAVSGTPLQKLQQGLVERQTQLYWLVGTLQTKGDIFSIM